MKNEDISKLIQRINAQDDKIFQLLNIITSTNRQLMDLKSMIEEMSYHKTSKI